ncbi:methyl-accepting chemotaxis protein [Bacillus tianshenii]|nr:methyl-accepting chemotaxis protein [Bacillus tianshenii]
MSQGYLSGDQSFKPQMLDKQKQIQEQINIIDTLNEEMGTALDTTAKWPELKKKWLEVPNVVFDLQPSKSFELHTAITSDTIDLIHYVADQSALSLDPELDTYYLMDSVVTKLPMLTESAGQARGLGTGIAAKRSATAGEQAQLISLRSNIQSSLKEVRRSYQILIKTNPSLEPQLKPVFEKANESNQTFLDVLQTEMIEEVSIHSKDFYQLSTDTINNTLALFDLETELLNQLLAQRIDNLQNEQLMMILMIAFTFAITLYLCIAFYVSVNQTVSHLEEVSSKLADGDLTVQANVTTKDELLIIGKAFNKMADSFRAMISQSQQVAEQVASSSEELSTSAEETGTSANQIALTISEIASGTTLQSEHMRTVLEKVEDTNTQVSIADESMTSALELSTASTEAVQEGKTAMNDLINQLSIVEGTVEVAQQSIQRLGSQSTEISSIITVISTIAEQTNLLALNAAIEAARAGEHGKGFAVVAEEVRKLAEESSQSAKQITTLINDIQKETTLTIQAMDKKVSAVENQSKIIERKRKVLNDIIEKVNMTQAHTTEMKAVFDKIKANSSQVLEAVQESSGIIEQSAASSQEVAASAEEQSAIIEEIAASSNDLAKAAESLNHEVSRFIV